MYDQIQHSKPLNYYNKEKENMKKKLWTLIILVLIASMMLAACKKATETTQPPVNTVEPGKTAEPVTLTMWTWKAFHVPALEALAKQYYDKTGVTVKIELITPDDAYRTRLQTGSQSGELPDIISYWSGGHWDEIVASDMVLNITDQVDKSWASSFLPGTFENTSVFTQARYDSCQANANCPSKDRQVGDVYSVPFTVGSFGIVYVNKTMMQAAGIDPSYVPADTTEFVDMLAKIQKATGKGATIGGKFTDILRNWIVNDWAMTNCGVDVYVDALNAEPGSTLTGECIQQAYGEIGAMQEANVWNPGFQTLTIDEADLSFAQGEAAADFGGSFTLGFLLANGMKAEDIAVMTLPPLPTSLQKPIALSPFSLIDIMVSAQSAHPQEAVDFIRFLTNPDNAATFAKMTGDLPGVAIPTDPAVVGDVMSRLASFYATASEGYRATDTWTNGIRISGDVWAAMDNVAWHQITGESDLLTDLKAADAAAKADRTSRGEP
jgi:ABC-type glycerol-3-phosphate transport system substrate-binding protein